MIKFILLPFFILLTSCQALPMLYQAAEVIVQEEIISPKHDTSETDKQQKEKI